MIRLLVNGEPRELAAATVAEALAALAPAGGRGLAVALNGVLVTRARWETTPLATGDRLEVVRAVSGG